MLETVELRDRAKDRVGGYSHGMRQRLGIAASLLRDPQLLLLDEPTTGLDPAGMRDMRDLVKRLAADGITILLSSHILAEVEELCNRVAIIRRGSIIYEGRLDELLCERRRRIPAALDRAGARTDACSARSPGIESLAAVDGHLRFQADEAVARRGDGRARPRRHRHHRARAADDVARGAVPRHDRRRELGYGGRGVTSVYKWELLKLLAQKRTYLGLGTAMLVPTVFVVVLLLQHGGPNDIPLGRYIRETGLATPFVVLFFMSIWAFPLLTALVAGDIVAAESQNGTLKTILTRSRNRGEIYAGKVLASFTYTAVILLAMGAVGVDRRRASRGGSTR